MKKFKFIGCLSFILVFVFALAFAVTFISCGAPKVSASSDLSTTSERLPHVIDNYGLLSSSSIEELENTFYEISQRQMCDVVAVIVNSTNGKSIRDFADDFFDYNGYGYGSSHDGIILVIDMDQREWWISTCGYGITAFTDAGIDYIGDRITSYMSDGDFYSALETFAELADEFLVRAKTGKPYDISTLPKSPITPMHFIIPVIIGSVIGFAGAGALKSQLNSVRPQRSVQSYIRNGSFALTESRDIYLYRTVSRIRRENNGGGGGRGGSSTHRSSSGHVHGGGGGRF